MDSLRCLAQRSHERHVCAALFLCAWVAGCTGIALHPAPVVPTKNPLPYSAKVKLAELAAYTVEPGATMIADPNLHNHVTGQESGFEAARAEWEKAILDYLATRRTFRQVQQGGGADLDLALRVIIYIDPSVQYKFNYIYVARIDATLSDPRSHRVIAGYSGFGKDAGDISRGGRDDDEGSVNRAVHAALNDLFGKIEGDTRLARL